MLSRFRLPSPMTTHICRGLGHDGVPGGHGIMRHWQLYLLMLLPIVWVIMFRYVPIWSSQIAFKDYKLALGVKVSPWAEPVYKHLLKFFKSNQFSRPMVNTVGLSLYNILRASSRPSSWPSR